MSSEDRFSCILSAHSPDEAAARLQDFITPLGISGMVYSSGRQAAPLVQGTEPVRRWVRHFVERNYFVVDPLYAAARKSVVPQFWHAGQRRPQDTPEQVRIYEEIGEFGIAQGFDLAIRDHEDEASLCFYCEDARVDLPAIHPPVLIGALYLHEAVRRCSEGSRVAAGPNLTPRERECLQLVRDGLTYAQAAQRLGIRERTVTFHLQNAKRKLGVATLAQAMACALLTRRL